MDALIIAAGDGTRMGNSKPKILLNINNKSLLEYHINTLTKLGIKKIYLVLGYKKEMVEDFIKSKGLSRRVKVIYNPDWEKGNAFSVLAAESHIKGDFLLVMGDHYYELEPLKGITRIRTDFAMVVDSEPLHIDIPEATKVRIKNGRVIGIGKRLKKFDTIDAGIFICSPSIFDFIKKSLKEGESTWNDVKRDWILDNPVTLYDVKGGLWYDIDTPEDLARIRNLIEKRTLWKPRDGIISRYLNRPISIRISNLFAKTPITPNQVTMLSFFIALISAFLFGLGYRAALIFGGISAQISSIIDGCDGEVARIKGMSSPFGAYLDSVLDRWADGLIIFGMAFGYSILHSSISIWPIALLALLGSISVSYTESKFESLFGKPLLLSWGLPVKRDSRLFLFMLGGLFNIIPLILVIVGSLGIIESLRRLLLLIPQGEKSQ